MIEAIVAAILIGMGAIGICVLLASSMFDE